ncbi:MAG: recombinase family protein [Clostridia bacterium]|nr:recombinase family protein [Clostridia bacterium]
MEKTKNPSTPAARRPRTYGYVRVSTREQNEARQIDAMNAFGVDEIFVDKQSGKDFDRPAYRRLLRRLEPDDVLVVKSIDRLGRDYTEILDQWHCITKERAAAIVVLDMPLLDTRNSRDLTGTLIADIVLQLLSYVAETERSFIRQRQAEGIAAAKARGQRFGRPCTVRGPEFQALSRQWLEGSITSREAGDQLGISHVTFIKWARNDRKIAQEQIS